MPGLDPGIHAANPLHGLPDQVRQWQVTPEGASRCRARASGLTGRSAVT